MRIIVTRIIVALFALVFSPHIGWSAVTQETTPDLVARTRPSVVSIISYDKDERIIARGSGFCISPNRFLTNKHVIADASHIEVHTADGHSYPVTKVVAVDENGDLAIIQTQPIDPALASLMIAKSAPRQGDRVLVLGNPLGLEGSVSDGLVAAFRTRRDIGKLLQITAPISPGSSGSPVINTSGEVVGVATLNLEGGQNLNFAISAERILDLWPTMVGVSDRSRPFAGTTALPGDQASARDLYHKGMEMYQAKDCQKGLLYFQDAIRKDPNYAFAYLAAGHCAQYLSRQEEAIYYYEQAVGVNPKDQKVVAIAYDGLGAAYYGLKRFDEAAQYLKKSVEVDSSSGPAFQRLGLVFFAMKKYKDAVESFKTALKLTSVAEQQKVTIYSLGLSYLMLGNKEAAIEQQKLLSTLDGQKAKELLYKIRNISGYWKSSNGSVLLIEDDGGKVVVHHYETYNRDIAYEAHWVDEIALGYVFSDYNKYRFVLKIADLDHIWMKRVWSLNLKDSYEKILKKAIQKSREQPDEIWTRMR